MCLWVEISAGSAWGREPLPLRSTHSRFDEVEEDVRPLKGVAFGFQPVLESLTYYQSQERAEHMSSDGPVILVKHRPRTEKALGGPEELLYHP